MRVYEKVRAYICDNGLKQEVVAQRAGISQTTFNDILNGKRTLYADELRRICIALNVSPELFVDVRTKIRKEKEMNTYKVIFTVDGKRTEQVVKASSNEEAKKIIKNMYYGSKITFTGIGRI